MLKKIKIFLFFLLLSPCLPAKTEKVKIIFENKISFLAEIAQSEEEKRVGLGFRKKTEDTALVFLYKRPQELLFWMKNMKFSLDILWINKNQIVWIEENIAPPNLLLKEKIPIYGKDILADKVLEVPAGKVKEYGIKKGMKVDFLF